MEAITVVAAAGIAVTGLALVFLRLGVHVPRGLLGAVGWLRFPLNAIAFRLRRRLRLPRREYRFVAEPKGTLFDFLPVDEAGAAWHREAELRTKFDLEAMRASSSRADYREVLYHLDVLDRLGPMPTLDAASDPSHALVAVDVGSKDFRYALALERWLGRSFARGVELTGVELDAYGVYRSFHTRRDRAEAHCRAIGPHVRYVVSDFLTYETVPSDVVTVFFPFVLPYAITAWGLPLTCFAPVRLFERCAEALRRGGLLVVANHTSEERDRTVEIVTNLRAFRLVTSMPMQSKLVPYQGEIDDRHLLVWVRER